MTRQKTNQILPNIFSLERSWGVAVVQQPVRLHDEASAYHLHHWWWWWWRCRWHQPWHRSSGHPAASQDAPGTLLRAQKQSRHWCGLYSFWPEKQMTKHVSGQASDNKRYKQTRTTLTLWTKVHLFSFEESDAWLVGIPPLLEVVHHHGWHGPGEAAHWRLERQVTRADDGDVEDTVFLLHSVGGLLKLHAGNWERGW